MIIAILVGFGKIKQSLQPSYRNFYLIKISQIILLCSDTLILTKLYYKVLFNYMKFKIIEKYLNSYLQIVVLIEV